MTPESDDGYHVRASMTFSELAHPAFVRTLKGLSSRGRSRLLHALVERGLSLGRGGGAMDWDQVAKTASATRPSSPLDALGSAGSLAGAEELGP
jgi:hypothetical protein